MFVTDGPEAAEIALSGVLHILGSVVAIVGLIVSAWIFRGVCRRDDGYEHFGRTQHWFAQRVLVTLMATWWSLLAAHVRHAGGSPGQPASTHTQPRSRSGEAWPGVAVCSSTSCRRRS